MGLSFKWNGGEYYICNSRYPTLSALRQER